MQLKNKSIMQLLLSFLKGRGILTVYFDKLQRILLQMFNLQMKQIKKSNSSRNLKYLDTCMQQVWESKVSICSTLSN